MSFNPSRSEKADSRNSILKKNDKIILLANLFKKYIRNLSESIGFIEKPLYLDFITKFAILQEQSFTKYERHKTEQNLLVLHSAKHMNDLKQLLSKYHKTTGMLKSSIGLLLF